MSDRLPEALRVANPRAHGWMPPELISIPTIIPFVGGATIGEDLGKIDFRDDRVLMKSIYYTTNKRIHGIWHYESPNQLFFLGYECCQCGEVFLVPDWASKEGKLFEAMQHGCTEARK